MKKVVLAVVGVLVLGAASFFLYISMIDWNLHKDKIASQFSNVTGKRVVFSGPVSFNVFPSPYLTASNVQIFSETGDASQPALATIKELVAELSLFPLLQGNFDVKKMSLIEPEMLIEVLPEGKLNWQSNVPVDYDKPKDKIEVALDSVMIEKAKLNVVSKEYGVNLSLDNLNAEVIADSIFGPYRIEGSYVNDNNPEGFALSLGQFSDSFATSLNFVVRHPKSDSYFRFDGSFFLKNSAVNGSMVIESARLIDFVSSYFPHVKIDKRYEFPLAMSMELNTNKTKIDVSNFVVKYGGTIGAGNILIPLSADEFGSKDKEDVERKKVEVAFNMTDLDLAPFISLGKDFYASNKDYKIDLGYDVLFDLKAVKTTYKDQSIRDFAMSFDVLDKNINVHSFGGVFPGETTVTSQGTIFSKDEKISYNFDLTANSLDFMKLSSWLGYNITPVNNSTYRNFDIVTGFSGNQEVTKISPLQVKLDKTQLNGEAGIIWGDRKSILTNLSIDSINFDNYFAKIPEDVSNKGTSEELKYVFSNFGFLNNYELKVSASLGLAIYNSVPFENMEFAFSVDKGTMALEKLNITSVKNSSVEFSGTVKDFGQKQFSFSNLKYNVFTQDFYSLFSKKMLPDFMKDTKDFRKFEAKGIVTGNLDKYATKSILTLDDVTTVYSGEVSMNNGLYSLNGKVDLRSPDFLKFVNNFGVNYTPDAISLGVLRLNSDVLGSEEKVSFKNMELYVGANKFNGQLDYSKVEDKKNITFDLNVNRFEFERFFYNKVAQKSGATKFAIDGLSQIEFLAKPNWDKVEIDYSPFQKYTLSGKLAFGTLTYYAEEISNAKFSLSFDNQLLTLQGLTGKYRSGEISSSLLELRMAGDNGFKGDVKLKEVVLDPRYFSGLKYGLVGGLINADITFSTVAKSAFDMMTNLTGGIKFEVANPQVKGWDLNAIEADLAKRTKSEGLVVFLQEKLQTGETKFTQFYGKLNLNLSAFEFVDTRFVGDHYFVEMKSTGNVSVWEAKTNYTANFYETPDKLKLDYSMSGPLSAPSLFVDGQNIISLYDQRNKKIEDELKAKEKQRQDNLLFLVDKQRDRARKIGEDLDQKSEFVLNKKETAKNAALVREYNIISSVIDAQKKVVNELLLETENPQTLQLSDALAAKLSSRNDTFEKQNEQIVQKIDALYYQDAKDSLNTKYNEIADRYAKNRVDVVKYRDNYLQYPTRMAVVGKMYVLDNDLKVGELKSKIEGSFSEMDGINSSFAKDYIAAQSLTNINDINNNINKLDSALKEMDSREEEISTSIKELSEYLEALVSEQETAYDQAVKESDVKSKIEENRGTISANGKVKALVRDLNEIQKSEEAVSSEGVVVLDFSKDAKKTEVSQPVKKLISREEINRIVVEGKEAVSQQNDTDKKSSSGGIIIRK